MKETQHIEKQSKEGDGPGSVQQCTHRIHANKYVNTRNHEINPSPYRYTHAARPSPDVHETLDTSTDRSADDFLSKCTGLVSRKAHQHALKFDELTARSENAKSVSPLLTRGR